MQTHAFLPIVRLHSITHNRSDKKAFEKSAGDHPDTLRMEEPTKGR